MENFADHFSGLAGVYAKYRPGYPPQLFKYLASLTHDHLLAWDCGTGNGQSAISLADHFESVIATDASEEQVRHAFKHPGVNYRVRHAEASGLESNSTDIITVSQALHWFDLEKFYAEAERVLKPGGILAIWCYGLPTIFAEADRLVKYFHNATVDQFWQEGNRMVEREYSDLRLPFQEETTPQFTMSKTMTPEKLCGLLRSWSATEKFYREYKYDPVKDIEEQLQHIWPGNKIETAKWKIILKIGRKKTI